MTIYHRSEPSLEGLTVCKRVLLLELYAVHETFLDIIRIIDSIRANNEKELSQFLRVLTHHKAVDMVRKCTRQKKSDTEIEDLDLSKSDVNVETIVLDKIDYDYFLLGTL